MNKVEVISIFKQYSDKKTESDHHGFYLVLWSGLNYMCKTKYKTLGNG